MSFPRYPKYKESGVEWLGEVPEHWAVSALKRGYQVTLGKMLQPDSNDPDDQLLPYLRAGNIQWGGVDTGDIKQMWISRRERADLRLKSGDLLISEGGDVGRSCLWDNELDECYFQNSVNRVRARNDHSNQYLCFWMSTIKDKGYIDVLCNKSTIAHFTAEKVATVPVPLPPLIEQTQIASFLARETAKIDALIAEQQSLIELLKEKRQAVISHAVTKGLNPHARLKPSGIQWLGDIPVHWSILPLRRVIKKFVDYRGKTPAVVDAGIPLITASAIRAGKIDHSRDSVYVTEEVYQQWMVRGFPEKGDVVFTTEGATYGETAQIHDERIALAQRLILLKTNQDRMKSDFLFYLFTSDFGRAEQWSNVTGTTVFGIKASKLKHLLVTIPPVAEQIEICRHIDREISSFENTVLCAQKAIALLNERRTAIISAAVTGQIDVRNLATQEAA